MTEPQIIPPDELATWAPLIVDNGKRGTAAQHLLVGWLGPRKGGQRVYAHPDGRVVGEQSVGSLHAHGRMFLAFTYRRRDLTYEAPTPEQYARRYRGG